MRDLSTSNLLVPINIDARPAHISVKAYYMVTLVTCNFLILTIRLSTKKLMQNVLSDSFRASVKMMALVVTLLCTQCIFSCAQEANLSASKQSVEPHLQKERSEEALALIRQQYVRLGGERWQAYPHFVMEAIDDLCSKSNSDNCRMSLEFHGSERRYSSSKLELSTADKTLRRSDGSTINVHLTKAMSNLPDYLPLPALEEILRDSEISCAIKETATERIVTTQRVPLHPNKDDAEIVASTKHFHVDRATNLLTRIDFRIVALGNTQHSMLGQLTFMQLQMPPSKIPYFSKIIFQIDGALISYLHVDKAGINAESLVKSGDNSNE